jgi:hypothetical protein
MACDKWIFLHTTVSLLFASTEERLGKQRNLGMNAPKLVGEREVASYAQLLGISP